MLWAGLRVAMCIAHVGGKFRHGLLEKSAIPALPTSLISDSGRHSLPLGVAHIALGG